MTPAPMSWAIALAALAAGVPSTAQAPAAPAPAPSDTTIVVTGKAEPAHKDVYDQAQDVTRIDPRQVYEVALPRFASPLCPGVMGLKDTYAQAMADRMRADAARLRLPLARPGCAPNVLVAFVDSGQATLGELQRKHPATVRACAGVRAAGAADRRGAGWVWNNIARPVDRQRRAAGRLAQGEGELLGPARPHEPAEAHDIHATLVLFDRAAVLGLTLTQLADYATMRGLSSTRPPTGDAPMATILSLFAGRPRQGPGRADALRPRLLAQPLPRGRQPARGEQASCRPPRSRSRDGTRRTRIEQCLRARRPCQAQRPP